MSKVYVFVWCLRCRPVLLEALYLNGQRPLTRAVALGRHRILQTLLQLGADLNAGDPATSRTALMYACQLGNSSCAKTLSDAGAQWHLQDRVGLSALQHALEGGEEVTRLALQAGSDVNLPDYSSWTPLMRIGPENHLLFGLKKNIRCNFEIISVYFLSNV